LKLGSSFSQTAVLFFAVKRNVSGPQAVQRLLFCCSRILVLVDLSVP